MKVETLCATKTVYDAIKTQEIKMHEYKVPDDILKYCSQARTKFSLLSSSVKAEKAREAEKRTASTIENEYKEAKKKNKHVGRRSRCLFEAG